jgi:Holliday junction resolvasome RuvABC endonuclease subunit
MKASKALKRLTHVEDLLGDVMERYSPDSPAIRETLQNAKTAVSRAKDTVSLQQAPPKTTSPQKKHAGKKAEVKAPRVKAAKKHGPAKQDYEG